MPNPNTSSETVLDALRWRYATKQFDPTRKLSDAQVKALEEVLLLTPSSFGLQPWRFEWINDPAIRAELVPHAWGQKQIVDASHLIVLTARREIDEPYIDSLIEDTAKTRGHAVSAIAGYRDIIAGFAKQLSGQHLAWNTRQVYIALGQLMTAAALMGIDACPMEGISPPDFDRILGLSDTPFTTVVACPVGYRHADDKYAHAKKVRFPASAMIRHR
jgi:nitroreductase